MKGTFIAGMGLPGSGKSAVFAALADALIRDGIAATLYREPEEAEWPAAVRQREVCGSITALTWFRAQRVPYIYQADSDRSAGSVALLDSYYDKLVYRYFDAEGFQWLMPKNDPYRAACKEVMRLDYETLPDASCVVSLTVDKDRWRELVQSRGRELDRKANLLDTFETQAVFTREAKDYCAAKGIPHFELENRGGTAAATAIALRERLVEVGVIR